MCSFVKLLILLKLFVAVVVAGDNRLHRNNESVRALAEVSSSSISLFEWQQIGTDIDGKESGDVTGRSVSVSADGTIVAVGAYKTTGLFFDDDNDQSGVGIGCARVFANEGSSWTQLGDDIDGDALGEESGYSVSLSSDGTVLATSAPYTNGDVCCKYGYVRVYGYNGSAWTQLGGDIEGEAEYDHLGYSIALNSNGTVLAIGAPGNQDGSGRPGYVRVFGYNDTVWVQLGSDIDGMASGVRCGHSVSLSSDGTILAIGAPVRSYNTEYYTIGRVQVFAYSGSAWSQRGSDINAEPDNDLSGTSISLNGDGTVLAIGAPLNSADGTLAGHVLVFSYSGSAWNQLGTDINGVIAYEFFGYSLSLSTDGSVLAIGAPRDGVVRVFSYNGTAWTQLGGTIYDDQATEDFFGYSVSLNSDGSVLAIGVPRDGDLGYIRILQLGSTPTALPSAAPTAVPTFAPTVFPSFKPTIVPSFAPSQDPSIQPTWEPTASPTAVPTFAPTFFPSFIPTIVPSFAPSQDPSIQPTWEPTTSPTLVPSESPTMAPSACPVDTFMNSDSSSSSTFATNDTCIACPSNSTTLSRTGAFSCACSDGFETVGFASSLICISCPAGSYSTAGANCSACAAGYFAAKPNSFECDICPMNTYSDFGSSACTSCKAGMVTPFKGSISSDFCLNPSSNFAMGCIALALVVVTLAFYIGRGRFFLVAIQRRKNLIFPLVEYCRERSLVVFQNIPPSRLALPSVAKVILFVFGGGGIVFVFAVIYYVIYVYVILINTMILWRGVGFLAPIDFIERMKALLKQLSFELPFFMQLLFWPLTFLVENLAVLQIDLGAMKVTCEGSQASVSLLIYVVIFGITVVFIESDYQIFWSTTLQMVHRSALQKLRRKLPFLESSPKKLKSVCIIILVGCMSFFINPFQIMLRYLMGFLDLASFTENRGVFHAVSPACDAMPSARWIDSVLGYSSSAIVLFMIQPVLYIIAHVLLPGCRHLVIESLNDRLYDYPEHQPVLANFVQCFFCTKKTAAGGDAEEPGSASFRRSTIYSIVPSSYVKPTKMTKIQHFILSWISPDMFIAKFAYHWTVFLLSHCDDGDVKNRSDNTEFEWAFFKFGGMQAVAALTESLPAAGSAVTQQSTDTVPYSSPSSTSHSLCRSARISNRVLAAPPSPSPSPLEEDQFAGDNDDDGDVELGTTALQDAKSMPVHQPQPRPQRPSLQSSRYSKYIVNGADLEPPAVNAVVVDGKEKPVAEQELVVGPSQKGDASDVVADSDDYPIYFDLCQLEYNELYPAIKDPFGYIVASWLCFTLTYIVGAGHILTIVGREHMKVALWKYWAFLCMCCGYWPKDDIVVNAMRLRDHYRRYLIAEGAINNLLLREVYVGELQNRKTTALLSSVVGTRAIILMMFYNCTFVSVLFVLICESPLFVQSDTLRHALSPLFIKYPVGMALEREAVIFEEVFGPTQNGSNGWGPSPSTGYRAFRVYLRAIILCVTQGRCMNWLLNAFTFYLAVSVLYPPPVRMTLLLLVRAPYILGKSAHVLLRFGEILKLDNKDFEAAWAMLCCCGCFFSHSSDTEAVPADTAGDTAPIQATDTRSSPRSASTPAKIVPTVDT